MQQGDTRPRRAANSPSGSATLRKELFGLRFANATGELDDTAGIGRAKRDLARALTVARERELRADAAARLEPDRKRQTWLTNQTTRRPRHPRPEQPEAALSRAPEAEQPRQPDAEATAAAEAEPRGRGRDAGRGRRTPRRAAPPRPPAAEPASSSRPRSAGARPAPLIAAARASRALPRSATPSASRSGKRKATRRRARRFAGTRQEQASAEARRASPTTAPGPPARRARARFARASSSPTRPTKRSPCGSTWLAGTVATRRSCAARALCMRTTRATRRTPATPCAWSRAGRCRGPSAGGSWTCWSGLDDPERDQAARGRQHWRPRNPLHPREGRLPAPYAFVGDVITATVKQANPQGGQKGRRRHCRRGAHQEGDRPQDGTYIAFDENAAVIIDDQNNPRGTRVFGPVARELRERNFMKIVCLAPEVCDAASRTQAHAAR